jgi:hypothetical protein
MACGLAVTGGCGADAPSTSSPSGPSAPYWALTLDHHAVTLSTIAPYDTIRLTATPRNVDGTPLTGLPGVIYASTDLSRVQVSADGVVQAVAAGDGIAVTATLQAGNLTHADTAIINVSADTAPRPLASLSIQVQPPDSATIPMGSFTPKVLPVVLLDVGGNPISDAAVYFQSSNPAIATVDRSAGAVTGNVPGTVTITATATVYGASRADSIRFTVGYPGPGQTVVIFGPQPVANSPPVPGFLPADVTISTGANVVFSMTPGYTPTDVTFDDPTHVAEDTISSPFLGGMTGAGNIPTVTGCTSGLDYVSRFEQCNRSRVFPVAGVYPYRSVATGAAGRVTVVDTGVQ